jgi:nitrite reductase (NADH) small subunit
MTDTRTAIWTSVCDLAALTPDRGVAALVDGRAVAVFALWNGDLAAIDNIDPCCGASVLSRGVVGDLDGRPIVASPMYKDRFDLVTGRCIDREHVTVEVHETCVVDGTVLVRLADST